MTSIRVKNLTGGKGSTIIHLVNRLDIIRANRYKAVMFIVKLQTKKNENDSIISTWCWLSAKVFAIDKPLVDTEWLAYSWEKSFGSAFLCNDDFPTLSIWFQPNNGWMPLWLINCQSNKS